MGLHSENVDSADGSAHPIHAGCVLHRARCRGTATQGRESADRTGALLAGHRHAPDLQSTVRNGSRPAADGERATCQGHEGEASREQRPVVSARGTPSTVGTPVYPRVPLSCLSELDGTVPFDVVVGGKSRVLRDAGQVSHSGLLRRGEAIVELRGQRPLVGLRRLGGCCSGNGPGGRSGMSLTERENLVARRLLRRLGFATDCWSVWDELPEPVDLSIGPRASRDGGAGQRTRSTPIAASTSSGASGSCAGRWPRPTCWRLSPSTASQRG